MSSRRRGGSMATAVFLSAVVGLSGCGGVRTDYGQLDLVDIRGTVTLDGELLAGAVVVFESPDQTYSFATTDATGTYRLMFNSEKPGVTPGPKIVRIRTSGGLGEGSEDTARVPEKVPARYNRDSQLRVTVQGSEEIDFELQSAVGR